MLITDAVATLTGRMALLPSPFCTPHLTDAEVP